MSREAPESFEKICGILKRRINELNKSYSMLFVGEMGSGKSLAAVSCACQIDPSFEKHPRVVFNVKDFVKELNKIEKGQCIIFDECGVGVPARAWQSQSNQMMSIISQILRFKNVCIIFTTPSMRFIDINVRSMLNAVIKMRSIDFEHEVSYAKYNVVQVADDGSVRNKDFIFYLPDGGREVIDPFIVPRPSPDINKWYDDISIDFKNQTIKKIMADLEGETEPEMINPMQVKKLYKQAETCITLLNLARTKFTWDEISKATGYSDRQLQNWIKDSRNSEP